MLQGQSMGGLVALLLLSGGLVPALGAAMIEPVTNLANMYAGTYQAAIKGAYGIAADGSDYAAKTAGHDPNLLANTKWAGKWFLFIASAGDNTVSKANNTDAFRTLIAGHVREAGLILATGDHGNASEFNAQALSAFYAYAFASPS